MVSTLGKKVFVLFLFHRINNLTDTFVHMFEWLCSDLHHPGHRELQTCGHKDLSLAQVRGYNASYRYYLNKINVNQHNAELQQKPLPAYKLFVEKTILMINAYQIMRTWLIELIPIFCKCKNNKEDTHFQTDDS